MTDTDDLGNALPILLTIFGHESIEMKTTNGHLFATPWFHIFLAFCLVAPTVCCQPVWSLQNGQPEDSAVDDSDNFMSQSRFAPEPTSVFFPPPRDMMRPLIRAIRVYHEGDIERSAELIGEFLAESGPEDFLVFTQTENGIAQNVVDVANSMLAEFPSAAIDSMQVRFGIPAQQKLNQAVANNDYQEIANVMRRYFYTPAGQEAAILMGHYHLDSDHPLLGAKCFQMVMDRNRKLGKYDQDLALLTGMSWYFANKHDLAATVFGQLADRSNGQIRIGSRQENFDPSEPLISLQKLFGDPTTSRSKAIVSQWTMLGGLPNRNARLPDGFPVLQPLWQVNTVGDKKTLAKIAESRAILIERAAAQRSLSSLSPNILVPSNIPLVVDGTVLAGDGKQIRGIDFQTGKRIWTFPSKPTVSPDTVNLTAIPNQLFQRNVAMGRSKPVANTSPWTDYLKGHVSSDGRRVYRLVEASVDSDQAVGGFGLQRRNYSGTEQVHWLQALDVSRQGTVVWQAGMGQKLGDSKLSEISFLGSPLPVDDQLFAIGKRRQEIVLVAIEAASGKLAWMQTLANDEPLAGIRYQAINTKAGHSLTPSYADGILVCPTGKDALVGVDIVSRSLVWGMQSTAGKASSSSIRSSGTTHSPQLVIDGSVVVGLEIGTSPRLMALDLLTGRSLLDGGKKSVAASKVLYVAGVHEGSMILIENDSVRRVAIKTGKSIWTKKTKGIGQPTGRGYLTKNSFYLPTDENLLVQFDLENGQIVDAVLSDQPFGNLIVHQGTLISQTETYVACHYLDSTAKAKLKSAIQQAGDIEKISPQLKILQANLLRADNKSSEALKLLKTVPPSDQGDAFRREFLRVAIQLLQSKSDATQELIQDYGSWFNFDAHPELFLSYIELLVQQGRAEEVVRRLLDNDKFFSASTDSEPLELISRPSLHYDDANADKNETNVSSVIEELPPHIRSRIGLSKRRIGFSPNQWAKSQLLTLSQSSDNATSKIKTLVEQKFNSLATNSPLEQFTFFRQLPPSVVAPETRIQLALRLLADHHIAEAEHLAATLERDQLATASSPEKFDFADLNDLTEKLAVAQQANSDSDADRTTLPTATPSINDVEVTIRSRPVQYQQNIPVDISIQGDYAQKRLAGKKVFVWSRSKEIEVIDRWGNSQHRSVLSNDNQITSRNFATGSGRLTAEHSLALLRLPSRIIVLDLNKLDQGVDPVRWQRTLTSQRAQRINIAGEIDAIVNSSSYATAATASAPVNGVCCFIDNGKLECIDAFTGQTLWQRTAPANHSQLLADSTRVISLDSRQQTCEVFDIRTGGRLETVKIPDLADVFWSGTGSRFVSASVVRESRLREETDFVDYRRVDEVAKDENKKAKTDRSVSLKSNRIFCCFDIAKGEFVWKKRFSLQAKACRMPGNRIVVLADDNQVYLFDADTGETLSKFSSGLTQAERKSVKHLGVANFGGRDVLLFAKTKSTSHSARGLRVRATRAMNTFFVGYVLALDPVNQKPLWKRPVELEGFQFLPMLPSGSPLMLFCRHIQSTPPRNNASAPTATIPQNSLQVLGVDWESGRVIVNTMAGTTNVQSFSPARIAPANGTVNFDLSSRSIQLKLRQTPDAPPSPVASITAFNPVPKAEPTPSAATAKNTPPLDLPELNRQLAKKAQEYEASLAQKRAEERRLMELESKRSPADR